MRFFPDPGTIVTVGGIYIRWYVATTVIGAILGYLFASRRMKNHGYFQHTTDDLLVIAIVCVIFGGRIGWIFDDFREYRMYLWDIFALSDGGFEVLTAELAFALGIRLYTKPKMMSYRRTIDAIMPGVLLAALVSEVGRCFSYPEVWWLVLLDAIGFLIVWTVGRHYQKGRKRGDLGAFVFMWSGIVRLIAVVFKLDDLAVPFSIVWCVFTEIFGMILYLQSRKEEDPKPVILFDFDGTLMDSEHMVIGCYAYLFQKYGKLEDFTKDKQAEIFTHSLRDELTRLFPEENPDKLAKEYREFQKSLPGKHLVQLLPHTTETLQELKNRGYKLGIVTSRLSESCEMWAEDLDIEDYFDIIVGTERFRHEKPAPDGIVRACEMLKTGHDNVIYIGDNVSDVEMGKNAGVYTIGYVTNWDKREAIENAKPNRVIVDITEILSVVKEKHAWSYERL